jgi:hypothetical protein
VSETAVSAERDKQQELAVSLFVQRYERLYDVASRVRQASADLCGDDVMPHFGFLPVTPAAFDD